jgi:hypothetical protein
MGLSEDMAVDPVPGAGLSIRRATRFTGGLNTCGVDEFTIASRAGLEWLYRWLEAVGDFSSRDLTQADAWDDLAMLITDDQLNRVAKSAHDVAPAQAASLVVSRVLHDLRGGALQQVLGLACLWRAGEVGANALQAVASLARDHAKVLRHSLIGLDDERRLRDMGQCLHGVANLRRRLSSLLLANKDGPVRVDFVAEWNGDFAITCAEFSNVLRQLYNVMGNAVRHTASQVILMRVHAKPSVHPQSVRFVVGNALTSTERARLSPAVVARTWRGYTTTGSGLGLAAGAALVSEAFGLADAEQAIDTGHVGSRVTDNGFIAWFHWPVVNEDAAQLGHVTGGDSRSR